MHTTFLLAGFLSASSAADTLVDLGDLNVGAARIPRWYPATQAESGYLAAKAWPEYDATCAFAPCPSGRPGFRDAPGDPMSSCSAVDPVADVTHVDAVDCFMDSAPDESVVYLPAGTYEIGDGGAGTTRVITVSRPNRVLRGESVTNTHLVITDGVNTGGGRPFRSSPSCPNYSNNSIDTCGSGLIGVGRDFRGTTTTWTAEFDAGDTAVTVASTAGFTVGGWILLEMYDNDDGNDCALITEPTPTDRSRADQSLGAMVD